jgi:hypothetical protein
MDYQLIMLPLEAGGTCILDYDPEMQENMEKSIMLCGREDLVLCSVPVVFQGKCSLHLISDNQNLDDFWEACVTISENE